MYHQVFIARQMEKLERELRGLSEWEERKKSRAGGFIARQMKELVRHWTRIGRQAVAETKYSYERCRCPCCLLQTHMLQAFPLVSW